jgi:hypothetical protein
VRRLPGGVSQAVWAKAVEGTAGVTEAMKTPWLGEVG